VTDSSHDCALTPFINRPPSAITSQTTLQQWMFLHEMVGVIGNGASVVAKCHILR